VPYQTSDGIQTTHACAICSKPFVPIGRHQKTCGSDACQAERRKRSKLSSPRSIAAARARNARWCAQNRGCHKRQPWLLGAPPVRGYLPGLGFKLFIDPEPRWPVDHRNTRAIHGLVTAMLGEPHQRWPGWALLPHRRGCQWAVFVRNEAAAEELYRRRVVEAELFRRPVQVRFGCRWRAKYPVVRKRGHRKLRVDAITPVVIQSTARATPRVEPTKTSLLSTLSLELPQRLGLEDFDRESLVLSVVSHESRKEVVQLGAKYGAVPGWVGHVVIDTNAVGEFLLRCAANGPGLGGRTAFGFGRIVVTAC